MFSHSVTPTTATAQSPSLPLLPGIQQESQHPSTAASRQATLCSWVVRIQLLLLLKADCWTDRLPKFCPCANPGHVHQIPAVTTPRSTVYKARVDSAPLPTAAALSNHFSDRKCLEVLSGWRGCRIEQEKCSCPKESGSVASVEAESED